VLFHPAVFFRSRNVAPHLSSLFVRLNRQEVLPILYAGDYKPSKLPESSLYQAHALQLTLFGQLISDHQQKHRHHNNMSSTPYSNVIYQYGDIRNHTLYHPELDDLGAIRTVVSSTF
jgi:hypothetical protein